MKFKLEDINCWPIKPHANDAGITLKNKEVVDIKPKEKQFVGLGVRVEIPKNHVGLLLLRSSTGTKTKLKLANGTGVIDSDYRGELIACLENTGDDDIYIDKYTFIAQLLVIPCLMAEVEIVERLSETDRGDGGFGSTNKILEKPKVKK